jgi:hypothetical protein
MSPALQAFRVLRSAALVAAAASLARCTGTSGDGPVTAPPDFNAAKAGASAAPTVTAANPSYGEQGDLGRRVTITGSGFEPGATAAWERGGAADPKIQVHSTEYVSSSQLVATIDIAADAELALYDVAVMTTRGKGIGTEAFEVTQATSIGTLDGSNTLVRGINSRGEATGLSGGRAFFWDPAAARMLDLGPGEGWDIDEAGAVIVGSSSSHAAVWTNVAGVWQMRALPRSASVRSSRASSVGSDPLTGEAVFIGGVDGNRPVLWKKSTSAGWDRIALPLPPGLSSAIVNDVNARGEAVGVGVFWQPTGPTTWTAVAGSGGQGINSDGTISVFSHGGVAAYARRLPDGTWSEPILLLGCAYAMAVDDDDRIVGTRCLDGDRYTGAVFVPPYDGPQYLGGLGDRTEGAWVEAVSPRNGWIGGTAPTRPVKPGVVWNPFLVF